MLTRKCFVFLSHYGTSSMHAGALKIMHSSALLLLSSIEKGPMLNEPRRRQRNVFSFIPRFDEFLALTQLFGDH